MDGRSTRIGRFAGDRMSLSAVIESWTSEVLLFVPDLPGFCTKASTETEAVQVARETIQSYIDWLIEGELIVDIPASIEIAVVETIRARSDSGPCFALDRVDADADHRELALAVGRASLSDLLFVFDDILADQKAGATRTLRHVAELDRWYATRMAPAQGLPFAVLEDELVQSASLFEETVDALAESDRPTTWSIDGEEWSIRKALRRRTSHLREHLPELVALLA